MYNCKQEKGHYCPSWTQPSYELEWKPYWKVVWKSYPIPCPPTPHQYNQCEQKEHQYNQCEQKDHEYYNNY